MTRVLIVGGGVGGLALAQGLHGAGVPVEVFERDVEADDWLLGYRIHVNRHGSRALHRCLPRPLWEAFVATAGQPGLGMTFHTERLVRLLTIEEELMTGGSADPADGNYAVSRIALRRLLLSGLDVHFGRTFERYALNEDGTVTAFFTDGSSAVGDVLIGADGANSAVRGQLLPSAVRIETDVFGAAGRLPLTEQTRAWLPDRIQHGLSVVLPRSDKFFFSAVFDGQRRTADAVDAGLDLTDIGGTALLDEVSDYVLWAFACRGPIAGGVDAQIRGWHPSLRRMVAETDPETVHTMRFKTASPVEPWPTTRVTLLGDAIHNMTPVMGLGANTALRDAALLARQLIAVHRGENLVAALREYERRMLAYGFDAVTTSRSSAYRFTSGNVVAKQGMRTWLRLCGAVPPMKRAAFRDEWTDDAADLPELPALPVVASPQ